MLNHIASEVANVKVDIPSKRDARVSSDGYLEAGLDSLKESLTFISGGRHGDAIFNEGSLIDNFSLNIFKKNVVNIPIIFITPENHFIMRTIEIKKDEFVSKSESNNHQKAFLNLDNLQKLLANHVFEERKKTRLLVKRGVTNIALLLNDVAAIYTKNKLVYAIDRDSKKYSTDQTLSELEEILDRTTFFRANRQYIVNINFVKSFKAYQKVKLLVDVDVAQLEEPVVISQHLAPMFKKWMEDA